MNIEIFSIGGYSSWCYYAPDRILFDCGEGFATNLRNRVFAVDKVFIFESHSDHIAGLPQFLAARDSARGDKDKPIEIYCDLKNNHINKYIKFLNEINPRAFKNGKTVFRQIENVELGNDRYLHVFPVEHSPAFDCFGGTIRERRKRLKEKYKNLDIKSAIASGSIDKGDLMEEYEANVFSYTLDSSFFDIDNIKNSVGWVADCTFLKAEDMDDDSTHMELSQILKIKEAANVKNVLCAHLSSRYNNIDIRAIDAAQDDKVFMVEHGKVNRFNIQ